MQFRTLITWCCFVLVLESVSPTVSQKKYSETQQSSTGGKCDLKQPPESGRQDRDSTKTWEPAAVLQAPEAAVCFKPVFFVCCYKMEPSQILKGGCGLLGCIVGITVVSN